jgi:hypothetical protein
MVFIQFPSALVIYLAFISILGFGTASLTKEDKKRLGISEPKPDPVTGYIPPGIVMEDFDIRTPPGLRNSTKQTKH